SSSEKSRVGARLVRPAEFTRISTLPNVLIDSFRTLCSEARSETSELTRRVCLPRASISFAAASTCSGRRDVGTTSAPASAIPLAIAKPIPDVPPTTTATLSLSSRREKLMWFYHFNLQYYLL